MFIVCVLYRSSLGSRQQCCYSSNGKLIVGHSGGGNVDRFAPIGLEETIQHQYHEILPFVYCCQVGQCGDYYMNRPSDNGKDYQWTPPGSLHTVYLWVALLYLWHGLLFSFIVHVMVTCFSWGWIQYNEICKITQSTFNATMEDKQILCIATTATIV